MTVVFRTIRDADVDPVVDLWRRCGLTVAWNDPHRDIAFARSVANADVLVGDEDGSIVASVMVGHDGHRGWIYYVAADPSHRGKGLGRIAMAEAEAWMKRRGVPKAELMIRRSNEGVRGFYDAIGWTEEPVVVHAKRFDDAPAIGLGTVETTVTSLEMLERPTRPSLHPPVGHPVALVRANPPTVPFYRWLYERIGESSTWIARRLISDAALQAVITDPAVEIYVLHVAGVPAGYGEVDRRGGAEAIELSYLGLLPEFIGRGYGRYLLDAIVNLAWATGPCSRLWVRTCSLDHPRALGSYQKAGFQPFRQRTVTLSDPRLVGLPLPDRSAPNIDANQTAGAIITTLTRPDT
ncbi:putative acetyltransferase [alpha proteobacterium BAL199]|jgi:ribosomal protein S18 acetylase RimI-like enzyme|nr:putative acetyltransferase [alpha proteobacterium BAL199]